MSFQVQYVTYNLLYQLNDDNDDDDDDDDDDNGGGDGEGDGDDDDDEEEEEEEDENCTSEKIKKVTTFTYPHCFTSEWQRKHME